MSWLDPVERSSRRERRIFLFSTLIALLILLIDQASKWFTVKNFELMESYSIIHPVLNFTYARNEGAAWSILSGHVWFLFAFGMLAAVLMILFFRRLAEGFPERYYALLLIFAGIAGNSFDRAFHGAVIDFIHVHYYNIWHYPIFNVADMAICTGVGIYMLSGLLRKSPAGEKKSC